VRWCPDGEFLAIFAPCIFSEPHTARFRPASYIRSKVTPCVEVGQTSNLRLLRLGEEEKEREKEENTVQKYNVRICYAGRP